jgi:hypothetical protein
MPSLRRGIEAVKPPRFLRKESGEELASKRFLRDVIIGPFVLAALAWLIGQCSIRLCHPDAKHDGEIQKSHAAGPAKENPRGLRQ